jgi:hypothetical protein
MTVLGRHGAYLWIFQLESIHDPFEGLQVSALCGAASDFSFKTKIPSFVPSSVHFEEGATI